MIIGNPKVSILLTSYNCINVENAIKSVLQQTYKNFELILLDDNSNKKTLKIYKQFKDPRIRFYNSHIKEKDRMKECPYARQINVGLDMAKGKLITYLCDDVIYLPYKLERMVHFLRWHPKVRVCYNRQKQQNGKECIILAPDRILKDPFYKVDHNSVMHYKSCVDKVGKWDTGPRYMYAFADAIFWRKLAKEYLFYPIREVLEIHFVHRESFSRKIRKHRL